MDARGEVSKANVFHEWYSEEAKRVGGDCMTSVQKKDSQLLFIRQPIGVCALITPVSDKYLLAPPPPPRVFAPSYKLCCYIALYYVEQMKKKHANLGGGGGRTNSKILMAHGVDQI